jgi:hypothetical protein
MSQVREKGHQRPGCNQCFAFDALHTHRGHQPWLDYKGEDASENFGKSVAISPRGRVWWLEVHTCTARKKF